MGFASDWHDGFDHAFKKVEDALNSANEEQLGRLKAEVEKWQVGTDFFPLVGGVLTDLASLMADVQRCWVGRGEEAGTGKPFWSSESVTPSGAIEAIYAKSYEVRLGLMLAAAGGPLKCRILAQCEWPEFVVWITEDLADPAAAVHIWVFGPDNYEDKNNQAKPPYAEPGDGNVVHAVFEANEPALDAKYDVAPYAFTGPLRRIHEIRWDVTGTSPDEKRVHRLAAEAPGQEAS